MIMSPTNEIYIAARLGANLPLARPNGVSYAQGGRTPVRVELCALRGALSAVRFSLRSALRASQRHRHQLTGGQLETLLQLTG